MECVGVLLMQNSRNANNKRIRPVKERPKRKHKEGGDTYILDPRLEDSVRFYEEVFGISLEGIENLKVPNPVDEKVKKPLFMLRGEEFLREALKKSNEIFGVNYLGLGHLDCGLCDKCLNSLIRSIVYNARGDSENPYVILVEESYNPSMQYANMQVYELEEQNIQGMTLAERLVFGLWFHWKYGEHVDLFKSTLCSGTYVEHEEEQHNGENLGASFVVYFHKQLNSLVVRQVNGEEYEENRAPRLVIA